jgi:hypothetical protein
VSDSNRAVVLTYPCSNGRILEEVNQDMLSSKIGKQAGKSKQELLFQLNEDGLKQALSSIHSNTAKK